MLPSSSAATLVKRAALYYDITSVHSWILFERLHRQVKAGRMEVAFRPVHVANLMTLCGNHIPYLSPSLRKNYFRDTRFVGALHDIPLKTPDALIDELLLETTSSSLPQQLVTLVGELHPDKLAQCSTSLWRRLWIDNLPIHTEEAVTETSEALHLPTTEILVQLDDPKWAELLDARQKEAIDVGAFGVPWLVMHEEGKEESSSFFGSDRWPLIAAHLNLSSAEDRKWIQPVG